jgi:hypothetical protein|nr:MAG TPA: hypothetical protein [Caudoviricetes sp.]
MDYNKYPDKSILAHDLTLMLRHSQEASSKYITKKLNNFYRDSATRLMAIDIISDIMLFHPTFYVTQLDGAVIASFLRYSGVVGDDNVIKANELLRSTCSFMSRLKPHEIPAVRFIDKNLDLLVCEVNEKRYRLWRYADKFRLVMSCLTRALKDINSVAPYYSATVYKMGRVLYAKFSKDETVHEVVWRTAEHIVPLINGVNSVYETDTIALAITIGLGVCCGIDIDEDGLVSSAIRDVADKLAEDYKEVSNEQ